MTGIQYAAITQEHIDNGTCTNPWGCAATLALIAALNAFVETYIDGTLIFSSAFDLEYKNKYTNGDAFSNWIVHFDSRQEVHPCVLKIDHDALTIDIAE